MDVVLLPNVGSVKSTHAAIKKLNMEKILIGGHPMAGSEK